MELYWLLRLPHIHNVLDVFGVTLFIISLILGVICFLQYTVDEGDYKSLFKICMLLIITSFVFEAFSVMCPSKTDLALMMGWDALKSDSVQEVIEILKEKVR